MGNEEAGPQEGSTRAQGKTHAPGKSRGGARTIPLMTAGTNWWGTALTVGLDELAECWLGHALPPVWREITETGWAPDLPARYCGRCGSSVGPGEVDAGGCAACRGRAGATPGTDAIVRLGPYAEPLRGWILKIKYGPRWEEMAEHLGRCLGRAALASGHVERSRAVVVPVPMPWRRRLCRGIDHAGVLARAVSESVSAPVATVLARAEGPTQASLPASDRRRTGGRGLRYRARLGTWCLADLDVLLVDDVATTGASLRAAARLLRRLRPRRIVAAVVAVSDESARRARCTTVLRPGSETRFSPD